MLEEGYLAPLAVPAFLHPPLHLLKRKNVVRRGGVPGT